METVQIVLDRKLLEATDPALNLKVLEEQECSAYRKQPQKIEDVAFWEKQNLWPTV